jgi:hypothetical protein
VFITDDVVRNLGHSPRSFVNGILAEAHPDELAR